jgi:hypothetical protein
VGVETRGVNVPLKKIPEYQKSVYSDDVFFIMYLNLWHDELKFNNSYFFRNCETARPNHECEYLREGCTACLVQ